ncbi:MAG: pilus assembly protein PilN [endosymbiont of Galathealinum brachiosum]|uniref:Pilus assembly protein PilN n=1 Tax=endosymbiont of Galathealinum brachiosum TaxID=2200906 RepID=A0A370DB98_9GAMM|nr:MAG: pilus assembly protein PilN [endosymbiont of Galathealinum brachiosum]
MAQINLLPWREELRKEQTNQFLTMTGLALMLTASIIVLVHMNISRMIDHQKSRNNILQNEIKQLDVQLLKIKGLEDTKEKLLSRMEIIQSLQQKRPQIVHLFDEIVKTIPEGLHITEIKQTANSITIDGVAESNGRVSAYMRNIDASEWMTKPRLQVIESTRKDGRGSKFILVAQQSAPKTDEEQAGEL